MEDIIVEILAELRAGHAVDDRTLVKLVHAQARRDGVEKRAYAKRQLLPFYQRVKREEPERWAAWGVDPELEERLVAVLRMKPRRSASGVATITVITKPWPCAHDCRYCPNDVRCPKSYLHDEPACARAEQNFYDPYLQVCTRLAALEQMGHATGKVELIVLGGTWTDYPESYQLWFVAELFRALNEFGRDAAGGAGPMANGGAGPVAVAAAGPGAAGVGPVTAAGEAGAGFVPTNEANSGFAPAGEAAAGLVPAGTPTPAGPGAPDSQFPGRMECLGGAAGVDPTAAPGRLGAASGSEGAATPGAAAGVVPAGLTLNTPAGRRAWYRACGLPEGEEALAAFAGPAQERVDAGARSYNQAVRELYGASAAWTRAAGFQAATMADLRREQRTNERAAHRAVGLVFETRPDAITAASLTRARELGATKIQMGVQSLDQRVLDANDRGITAGRIQEAFELLRAFGFKIHVHAMVNLLGSTPDADRADYRRLMEEPAFRPDEVKLYPCALIEGTGLCADYGAGRWQPYTEEELLEVLCADVLATPAYCRVSRMIRDFSSEDIVAGNKKPNLRQLVEERLRAGGAGGVGSAGSAGGTDAASQVSAAPAVQEIRFREVGVGEVDTSALRLDELSYQTTNTREHFLQWVTPEGRIAGFLRLSLPDTAYVRARASELPVAPGEAMIREVHVYGMATQLGHEGRAAQHLGLGRQLVRRACEIARAAGCRRINVISAVGTREYYRGLGFEDAGLYQQKDL